MRDSGDRAAAREEWRHGWTLVLASCAGASLAPLSLYTMGLFVVPLEQEFGWSRTIISSGLTLYAVISVILAPFVGALIDRFGPRRIALPGTALYCFALGALSTVTSSQLHWLGLWLLLSLGAVLVKPTAWSAAIVSRFDISRGLALAMALCGTGLTGIFAPLIGGYLIENFGWRWAYTGIGLIWFSIAMPLLLLFFYGAADLHRTSRGQKSQVATKMPGGMGIREAMRSLVFLKLAVASFSVMLIVTAGLVHFVPMVTGDSFSRSAAVGVASVIGIAAFFGRLITGSMLDRFNGRMIGGAVFALPSVACIALLGFDGSVALAVLIAAVIGFCSGAEVEVASYLSSRYFGMKNFGTLFGLIGGLISFASGIGPTIASVIYDSFGSYDVGLWFAIPLSLVAGALIASLGPQPAQHPAD